jgi:hypothetical protein
MQDLPPFGRELVEAREQLEQVLARCAIRLKSCGGVPGANDNALFPGVRAPGGDARSSRGESAHEQTR